MDKHIISFCEGDHDIEFLSRILLVEGFSLYEKEIRKLKMPFNNFYIKSLENKIRGTKFKYSVNREVPYKIFTKSNTTVVLHNIHGDGSYKNGMVINLQKEYLEFNDESQREIEEYDYLNYRFLYFLDSDDVSVKNRLHEISEMLGLSEDLQHYKIERADDYEVGCCVFYDVNDSKQHGKLENILLELMEPNNEEVFKNSASFLEDNPLDDTRRTEWKNETHKGSSSFKKEKAIISIAGQLQFSGSTNSVIIGKSDYIKEKDILNNSTCQNIIKLFQ